MITRLILIILQCTTLRYVHATTYGDTHEQAPLDNPSQEPTYLRLLFSGGEEQFFRNWECPEGIWAEDMHLSRKPTCVCVKGVYAIGTDLCDDNFKIITGDEHCYDIRDKTIRKFIPLTGKSGFAGRANTVFRKDAPYFARLMSSVPTTSVDEPMHFVFRMNDPNDFTAYARLDSGQGARLRCWMAQSVADDPSVAPIMQIARLPNCSNEFRGPKSWCTDIKFASNYDWSLQVGDSWSNKGEIGKGKKYPGGCAGGKAEGRSAPTLKKSAEPPKKKHRGKRGVPKKRAKFNAGKQDKPKGGISGRSMKMAGSDMTHNKCDKFNKSRLEDLNGDTSVDHFIQIEVLGADQAPTFHSASLHQKEIFKQNNKIGNHLRKFFMNMTAPPNFAADFKEFQYVRTAKEIFTKICPEEFVPGRVVNILTGVFRLLYIDSSLKFAYPIPFNEFEHARIMDGLTKCSTAAKPVTFEINKNKSIPSFGMDVIAVNQSLNETEFISFIPKLNLSMPGHAAFNFSSIDVALELVWKMTLLTHYYCAIQFEENPFDLSQFYMKVEAMLKNPIMQFRWYYPGQFNRMMQFFLMSNDLKKFVKAVDLCVATTVVTSAFPGWISRPADLLAFDGGRSRLLSHEVSKTINSPIQNLQRGGRKKRFYVQDDMWKKQAYCMHSTDAPFTEVRTSTFPSCKKRPIWFENID